MKIADSFLLTVGVLMTVPVGYFVSDRIEFVRSSRTTMGTVEKVRAWNSSCGDKETPSDCTNFEATLRYSVDGEDYEIDVSAGQEHAGHRPISEADHQVDDQVAVAYDPREPSRAYRDTLWDVWRYPAIALVVQICALIGGFTADNSEPRRRTSSARASYVGRKR